MNAFSVFLVVMFLTSAQSFGAAPAFCEGYEVPKAYELLEKEVEKRISTFANQKLIASQADALLSKLITAKSPVLISWMNKRNLAEKSEDHIAREWRTYYAMNFVLTKYPSGDPKVDIEVEKLVDGILKKYLTPQFQKRTVKLFEAAQKGALTVLDRIESPEKAEAISRIKAIQLYWPKSLKTARNNSIPLDLIDWGIAYDPVANQINMGIESLSYPNDDTYTSVFAHEIAHSIDSCRWSAFFKSPWPYEKVGQCLRGTTSIGAKTRDDSSLDKLVKEKKIDPELAQSLKQNPTCTKLVYPPPGQQADQLPESFADWFSTEVLVLDKTIDSKKVRMDLCSEKELREGSSYPTNRDRLAKIYHAHPVFKAQRKTPPDEGAAYCAF